MILREQDGSLILIEQHEHARLSGWLATCWGNAAIPPVPAPSKGLLLAASLHDVGWLQLDQSPAWNEGTGLPYTFLDERPERKIPAYRRGLDAVAGQDAFAGLLCSLHYTSFFSGWEKEEPGSLARDFVEAEQTRRHRLRDELRRQRRQVELSREAFSLQLLKLWDDLSLYVALNQPGTPKAGEHPWYREGFRPTWLEPEGYPDPGRTLRFQARWLDDCRVALDPYPLREPLLYPLPYRSVSSSTLAADSLVRALAEARVEHQVVEFVPDPKIEAGGRR